MLVVQKCLAGRRDCVLYVSVLAFILFLKVACRVRSLLLRETFPTVVVGATPAVPQREPNDITPSVSQPPTSGLRPGANLISGVYRIGAIVSMYPTNTYVSPSQTLSSPMFVIQLKTAREHGGRGVVVNNADGYMHIIHAVFIPGTYMCCVPDTYQYIL